MLYFRANSLIIKISNNQELVNPDVLEAAHNMMVLGPAKGR
jgi:hypothetical protein